MLTLLRLQPPDQPDQLEGAKYSVLDFKLACRMKPTAAQHAATSVTSPPQSKPMASSASLGLDQSSGIVNKTRSKVTNLDLLNHSMCDTHNEREECAPKKGMLFGRWHSRASRIATGQAVCVCSAAGLILVTSYNRLGSTHVDANAGCCTQVMHRCSPSRLSTTSPLSERSFVTRMVLASRKGQMSETKCAASELPQNGNYYSILGLYWGYWDNGKENGNYYSILLCHGKRKLQCLHRTARLC